LGHHDAEVVLPPLALGEVDVGSVFRVATLGHTDDAALERARAPPAAYVGLVAAAPRADAVLGYLRDRGVDDDRLARVHAPAGVDLGHVGPEEIAVAIVAEIVRLRAAGQLDAPAGTVAAAARHQEIDPVCGMSVDVADARHRTTYQGRTWYFCSAGCLASFELEPTRFQEIGS
jgi:xanthine dehydrogenase accessory factor